MYASRFAVFYLAFLVALVSAVPLHHNHRRSKCRPRSPLSATVSGTAIGVSTTVEASSVVSSYASAHQPTATSTAVSSDDSSDSSSSASSSSSRAPTSSSRSSAATSTSRSSVAPSPTNTSSPSSGSGGIGGLLKSLFPVSGFSSSWTTSSLADNARSLSDAIFNPRNVLKSVPHKYANAPDGKKSVVAHYPKGSYTFGHSPQGGFSFYAPGPSDVDLTNAKEATFGYSLYFPEGFSFQKGGKLPGIYGGNSEEDAVSCSGGRRSDACFSARLMWRAQGAGEFYTYLPPGFDANQKVCSIKPFSDCNPTYGASVGRGAFTFPTGEWTFVSERVKLNDVGQSNGEIELFVNGKSVIQAKGLVLRNSGSGKMRGIQMQTFFGGSSTDFASPKDQDLYFSDFSVAITETF